MPIIKIDGQPIEVDIIGELSEFPWIRPRWTEEKLIAASPFRYDVTPSFFVSLEHGGWKDSGAYDVDWESGGFVKLLSFLREETYAETVEYLHEKYSVSIYEDWTLPEIAVKQRRQPIVLPEESIEPYAFRHAYLCRRGISERVQQFLGVGYTKQRKAVTIPWRHVNGTLANVKYRKVRGKAFWYRKDSEPIRRLVYALDKVEKHEMKRVYVCEAEIDAMSIWTAGAAAVAVGGASVSRYQLDSLRRTGVETFVLATDNDKAGVKLRNQLRDGLRGVGALERLIFDGKDVNEALIAGTLDIEKTEPMPRLSV